MRTTRYSTHAANLCESNLGGARRRGEIRKPAAFLGTLLVLLSLIAVQAASTSQPSKSASQNTLRLSNRPSGSTPVSSASTHVSRTRKAAKATTATVLKNVSAPEACGIGAAKGTPEPRRHTVTRRKTATGVTTSVTSNYPLGISTDVSALVSSKLAPATQAAAALQAQTAQTALQASDEGGPDPTPNVEATTSPTATPTATTDPNATPTPTAEGDPTPTPTEVPCGEWNHISWIHGVVTWTKDAEGDPIASITNATEVCSWDDPCADSTKPQQYTPRGYQLLFSGIVQENGGWVQKYEWRADPGCEGGMPIFSIQTSTLPKHWKPAPDIASEPPSKDPIKVVPCAETSVSVAAATDTDTWTLKGGASGEEDDTVSYKWSGPGLFPEGVGERIVKWKAPSAPGRYTLTCTVDDGGTLEPGGLGNRNDEPVALEVKVDVYAVSLAFVDENLAAGAKGDVAHRARFKITITDGVGEPISGMGAPTPEIVSGGRNKYDIGDPGPLDDDISARVTMTTTSSGADGTLEGVLTSGHRIEDVTLQVKYTDCEEPKDPNEPPADPQDPPKNPILEPVKGPTATIGQVWNELPFDEQWDYDPYFDFDVPSTLTFNMGYDRAGQKVKIPGHSLEFYTSDIRGFEWNPDSGEDWDGDDVPDGDYDYQSYTDEDADTSGFDYWSPLVEWGSVSESNGSYHVDQTIRWNEDFITDWVGFWAFDNDVYGPDGFEE